MQESSEWSTSLSRAISFLHAEYRPEYFYWELVELMRKLTLTGFLLLIPQRLTLLRLVAAILLTNAHLVLLQAAAPYKQASTAFVAVATSLTLACTLVAALLIKMYDELPAEMIFDFFGFDSAFPLTVIILFFNFGVLFLAFTLFALQVRVERRALLKRRLRYVSSHEEVRARPHLPSSALECPRVPSIALDCPRMALDHPALLWSAMDGSRRRARPSPRRSLSHAQLSLPSLPLTHRCARPSSRGHSTSTSSSRTCGAPARTRCAS